MTDKTPRSCSWRLMVLTPWILYHKSGPRYLVVWGKLGPVGYIDHRNEIPTVDEAAGLTLLFSFSTFSNMGYCPSKRSNPFPIQFSVLNCGCISPVSLQMNSAAVTWSVLEWPCLPGFILWAKQPPSGLGSLLQCHCYGMKHGFEGGYSMSRNWAGGLPGAGWLQYNPPRQCLSLL